MPIIASAKKQLRADARKNKINKKTRGLLKAALKEFEKAPSSSTLSKATSALDTAAKKGIIHKKTADRRKSRFSLALSKTKSTSPTKASVKSKRGKKPASQ